MLRATRKSKLVNLARAFASVIAQERANSAWAFANAGQRDEALFAALAEAVTPRLIEFTPQGLANTAWAFANMAHLDVLLLVVLASAAEWCVSDLNP